MNLQFIWFIWLFHVTVLQFHRKKNWQNWPSYWLTFSGKEQSIEWCTEADVGFCFEVICDSQPLTGCIQRAGKSDSNQVSSQIWFLRLTVHTVFSRCPIGILLRSHRFAFLSRLTGCYSSNVAADTSSSTSWSAWRTALASNGALCSGTVHLASHRMASLTVKTNWCSELFTLRHVVSIWFGKIWFQVTCDCSDYIAMTVWTQTQCIWMICSCLDFSFVSSAQ